MVHCYPLNALNRLHDSILKFSRYILSNMVYSSRFVGSDLIVGHSDSNPSPFFIPQGNESDLARVARRWGYALSSQSL